MDNDLKQIRDMQLKMDAKSNGIQKTLNSHTKTLNEQGKKIDMIWDQTVHLTEEAVEIQETLDSHTDSLKRIEAGNERNAANIKWVDKRAGRVEDQLGIVPPPELTIT